ncbi:MAG: methylenetetrahydrofolate reductase [Candidatus Thermoplasmatota archaeon]|nr:methylenetetrahydrofolate reductase [Candidatus Thermoplasmatota archaeon]
MEISSISKLKFVKSVEFVPARNLDLGDMKGAADLLKDVANVVTAPENPMGLPGIDPVISTFLVAQEYGLIAMPHLTPRDKNRLYIHSQVLTALKIGIRNFFIIGGDPINSKSNSREVREIDVMETIESIGKTSEFTKTTMPDITIGSALNPYRDNEQQILERKLSSGSNFFISQIIFEPEHLRKEWLKNRKFKVSAGFMPITRKSQLDFVSRMGVKISPETLNRLRSAEDVSGASLKIILEAYEGLRGYVDGVHLMPLGNNKLAKEILECI